MKITSLILIVVVTVACKSNTDNKTDDTLKTTKEMTFTENHEIKEISIRLKEGMIDFIEPGESSYSESDVEKCMTLLTNYILEIENTNSKKEAMTIVKRTVLALNELNENCEYELIETDQREDIAEILILAGSLKGYNSKDEDITEDWREW